jgi:transposase
VADRRHVKKVLGRKTEAKDTEWGADLLWHGLRRASFVPPPSIRELRDLPYYPASGRKTRGRSATVLLKLPKTANSKLAEDSRTRTGP